MPIEITTHPNNKQVTIGSSVTLTCTSSLSSHVTFSWTHNRTTIRNSDTSMLEISNVSYSDGGSYVCIMKNGSLSVGSNAAIITVYGKLNYVIILIVLIT